MLSNLNQKLYFISGPTAIGKSLLAIRLAKRINAVIINADSMQVYSNLKILTARPSQIDHDQIKHELYGFVDGAIRYNVANWCRDVLKIIEQNEKKNTPSIIVGGSGMYIDSLLNGLINLPPISETYKKQSQELLNKLGLEQFNKMLIKLDPVAVNSISINDNSRMRRVWEIYKSTGIKYSIWKTKKNKKFLKNFLYNLILFTPSRDQIYKNINNRFKKMIKDGAIEEVKRLKNLKLDTSLPIMRAHGVPEIIKYLDNKSGIEECIEKVQQVTRNYAKRQLSWWRSSSLPFNQTFNQFPKEIDENMIKI